MSDDAVSTFPDETAPLLHRRVTQVVRRVRDDLARHQVPAGKALS